MKRLVAFIFFAVLMGGSVFGQVPQPARPSTEFFPIEQIKPGMRAVGYTVFVGSEPKPFELEILGVLKGFPNPGQSSVLSKLLGTEMNHTGVFQGMSGSPVYIDGKLVGAVAYGYMFAKDPIAGITPIQHMIEVFEQRQPSLKPGDKKDLPAGTAKQFSFSEISFNESSREYADFVQGLNTAGNAKSPAVNAATGAPVLMPIATPLAISGVAPQAIARFAPLFQSWGFTPVAGVSGAAEISELKKSDANTLKPGSTIVVPLVRGDFSLAAAGTVTYRDGNKVYAFGHPFLSLGVSEFPMHEGEVVTVMSSQATSFKLSYPTAMVGTMNGDRSTGILGELGVAPRMIPVEINLRTSLGEQKKYNFDVVADRFLTPILMQITTISTLLSTEREIGDSTLQLRSSVKLKGQPEINLEDRISVSVNAPMAAAFAIARPVVSLLNSNFKDLQFEKLTYDIISREWRNRGQLDRLWVNRSEVRRGEKLEIQAFARTEGGGEFVERIELEIPQDAPLGSLQIVVGDGAALQASEARTGFTAKSLDQLVRELNRIRKADRLYVQLARTASGAVIKNEELPSLPPSVLATLGSERTSGGYTLTSAATVFEKELPPAEFVVSGKRTLTVNVVNQ